jgi:hypothetical protein
MRLAYADPPYPGQSKKHYGDHPDYAGEVDHRELGRQLLEFDGWILHTSSTALFSVQKDLEHAGLVPLIEGKGDYRVMSWVKPFAAFKANVPVAYAWEPVLVKPSRKPAVSKRLVLRDFFAHGITLKRGLSGVKPEPLCRWAFEVMGAEQDDELHDLFPGSGAVSEAWKRWSSEIRLELG